jgi:hypothetical protein
MLGIFDRLLDTVPAGTVRGRLLRLPLRALRRDWREACWAWPSPTHRLHWLATCGTLEGLAANHAQPIRYHAPAPIVS